MAEALKHVYSPDYITTLANQLSAIASSFDRKAFVDCVFDDQWDDRELKARMRHVSLCFHQFLPADFAKATKRLRQIADLERPGKYRSLADMCFPDFVQVYGLEDPDISFPALAHLSCFSSSEFAIRPFIIQYPEIAMAQMRVWATDENHHIRRLASEGCRPRLPWAMALPVFKKDPSPILPILELLKTDASDYVRRSVANNLNDIAKDHPEIVLGIGKKWIGTHKDTDWIVKHASRSLLKQGHPKALALFGFTKNPQLTLDGPHLSTHELSIGEYFRFTFSLKVTHTSEVKLRLEYGIYYMKANGSHFRKVFQLSEAKYAPQTQKRFDRKQSFTNLTTRKHYPGLHKLVIIVNGVEMKEVAFELK